MNEVAKKMQYSVTALMILSVYSVIAMDKPTDEPTCTLKFDYDYKMLQKMITLEIEYAKLKDTVTRMNEMLKDSKGQNNRIKTTIQGIDNRLQKVEAVATLDGTGGIFIRWGKTTCPKNGTELVYKGYAGGSHYSRKGAASSYLCLPEDPVWDVYEDEEQTAGTVWGAEYELYGRNMDNFFGKTLLNFDVPCCVCRTKRASVMMIPGRNICYDGWTLEYGGYLTSGHDSHRASDFVCVDKEPEVLEGGASDEDGKLFYFVEARCGSLRCPPYVNGRELTCAVCSK